jgi:integrase
MLAIVKRAGVRCRRSIIHVTRHTFGSRLIQQGESLVYVKEQMGHASIQSPIKQSKHSSDLNADCASRGVPRHIAAT